MPQKMLPTAALVGVLTEESLRSSAIVGPLPGEGKLFSSPSQEKPMEMKHVLFAI